MRIRTSLGWQPVAGVIACCLIAAAAETARAQGVVAPPPAATPPPYASPPSYFSPPQQPFPSGPVPPPAIGGYAPAAPSAGQPIYPTTSAPGMIDRSDLPPPTMVRPTRGPGPAAQQEGTLQGQLEFKEFSRSPAGVLNALSEEALNKQEAAKQEAVLKETLKNGPVQPTAAQLRASGRKSAAILQEFVVRGDWKALQQTLAEQPSERGMGLFGQVVYGLRQRQSQVTLLPDDVLALADAAPQPLSADDCAALGSLLKGAVDKVQGPQQALRKIQTGTRRLGGSDPAQRLAAARVLMAAELFDEAAKYLPPLQEIATGKDAELLNLCAQYSLLIAQSKQQPAALAVAWQLTQRVLELPDAPPAECGAAIQRSLQLLPVLGDNAEDWVRKQLAHDSGGLRVLAVVASDAGPSSRDPEARLKALATLQKFGEQLVRQQEQQPSRSKLPLTMLTLLWIEEAELALNQSAQLPSSMSPTTYRRIRHIQHGGGFTEEIEEESSDDPRRNQNRPMPLPAAPVLALAPTDAWRQTLAPDLAGQVMRLQGGLGATAVDVKETLGFAKLMAAAGDEAGAQLISALLVNWSNSASQRDPSSANRYYPRPTLYNTSTIYGRWAQPASSTGVPLTRAHQVRRLKQLIDLLALIRATGLKADYDEALVQAFASCHSPAEVYLRSDIQDVLGPPEKLTLQQCALLAGQMQEKLRGLWQRPDVQTQNNTNRTPDDQALEVRRGYELAVELISLAMAQQPDEIGLHALLAATLYDQAEFLYGQQADLKTYTSLRDRAFTQYAEAVKLYSQSEDSKVPGKQRVDLFARWFSAALGASELSNLTAHDTPQRDQIEKIGEALRALGKPATDMHLQLFAESLVQSSQSTPPQLKPWCFREALRIIGDQPAGDPLRKLLQLYDELLAEIELGVQVDGSADVGSKEPFGVHVALRGTRSLQREANGFAYLLGFSAPGSADDPKEKLKKMFKQQLEEHFEIDVVQFHDNSTQPRPYGRGGWLEKPLAYLVLRAKTPAVDRIPPLSVDLEFADGAGNVLLPVASPPVLISAAKRAPRGALSAVKMKQTFDDRQAGDEVWRLEIKATASGLACDLDQVLKQPHDQLAGFAVTKVEPNPIAVMSFDLSGKEIRPVSQRTWTLHLAPRQAGAAQQFTFPLAADSKTETKLERYDNLDVVDAPPVLTVQGRAEPWLTRYAALLWTAGVLLAAAAVAGGIFWLRRRAPQHQAAPSYRRPESLTPFNLLVLLRRIQADEGLQLNTNERAALGETVAQLEGRYFARPNSSGGDLQLVDTLNHWLARATSPGVNGNGRTASAQGGRA